MSKDKYTKIARVYPSIVGAILPCFITVVGFWKYLPTLNSYIEVVMMYLGYIGISAIVFSAIAYLLRELVRNTSKIIFQFPLFKENETNMPTTKMLLWSETLISDEYHNQIASKVKTDFQIQLLPKEKEMENLPQAKLIIANAVQQMRDVTRDDSILLQYNYEYGFCRNYLGASVLSIVYMSILWILNIWCEFLPWWAFALCIVIQLIAACIAFVMLKHNANAYARQLYSAYMTTRVYKNK